MKQSLLLKTSVFLTLIFFIGACGATTSSEPEIGATRSLPTEVQPFTVRLFGDVLNASDNGAVPEELTITAVSIKQGSSPEDIIIVDEQEAIAENGQYEVAELNTDGDSLIFIRTEYNGVIFNSEGVPARIIPDNEFELPINIYESTNDENVIDFIQAWYIVGVSPDEELTQIFNWYFMSNTSDRVYYDKENQQSLVFELPEEATGITVPDPNRFIVDESGPAPRVIDTRPIRTGIEDDLITISYLLPYTDAQVDIETPLAYPWDSINIYLATIFDLSLDVNGFVDDGIVPIRGLGNYRKFVSENDIEAGSTLAFGVSGDQPYVAPTPDPADAPIETEEPNDDGNPQPAQTEEPTDFRDTIDVQPVGPVEEDQTFLQENSDWILVLGILMVVLGFVYLVVDIFRQNNQPANTESTRPALTLTEEQDRLVSEIAALDDAFDAGDIDEADYQTQRAELKDKLRNLDKK